MIEGGGLDLRCWSEGVCSKKGTEEKTRAIRESAFNVEEPGSRAGRRKKKRQPYVKEELA